MTIWLNFKNNFNFLISDWWDSDIGPRLPKFCSVSKIIASHKILVQDHVTESRNSIKILKFENGTSTL